MSAAPDREIAAALARAGIRARHIHPIANIDPLASGRSVYRIESEAGRSLKARRLNDAATARRLFEIRRELPSGFAPAFDLHENVLLEDWIDGEPLGDACPNAARLAEAGALLAQLHSLTSATGESLHARRSTRRWRERSEQGLARLLAGGALASPEVDRIFAALERLDPQQAIFGLVHSDFCGENMLIDRSGRLRVIDNERIGIDALGFDLGRCWYRWALPPGGWEAFRAAYAAAMPFSEPLEHFGFWSLVAVVQSAALRLRLDPGRVGVPLACLREMLSTSPETRTPLTGLTPP